MPIITVTLIEGYDKQARQRLCERLTDATCSVINAPAELVTVVVNEVPAENYMRGRVGRQPGPALADQAQLVQDYLTAMENRDLEKARGFLAPDFRMVFPGGVVFTEVEQLIEWAKGRYQSIAKTYEHFDQCVSADGVTVYCAGTLSGVWPDQTEFSGIRFIDRFTVADGLLVDQQVWNDIAEVHGV
ncbi:tautomerase [Chromatiales bacterium (ex Bugula neritina AB1)]|nr:tautomerase [Chromatiales bacterium (ex Bugula neritina AB1)]